MHAKLITTAAILVASTAAASAATQTETGVISKIDSKAPSITLASGAPAQFWLLKGVNVSLLKVGEKVTVSYDMQNGKPMASAVVAAS
jgi:Cu/Ag efflux protein CusF